jgi:hypothetical protein
VELAPHERELVGWFRSRRRQGRLPTGPFWLRPGVQVCEPELLYDELEAGCAEPPRNPHARHLRPGRLADLRRVVERPIAAPRPDGVDAYNR